MVKEKRKTLIERRVKRKRQTDSEKGERRGEGEETEREGKRMRKTSVGTLGKLESIS